MVSYQKFVGLEIIMGRRLFLVLLTTLLIVTLIATSCASMPKNYFDNGVSDEEYISVARNTEESRAFLVKYPQAEVIVDRSSQLAVDFRINKHPVTSTTQNWEGIRLRVFIDPKTKQPAETFLQCDNKFVKESIIQYLEQFAKTQSCP
jgi:hypothetical protein